MRKRHSSNPIDKMCAIAFPIMKCNYGTNLMTLPIYDSSTPTSVAWEKLISSLASTTMTLDDMALLVYPIDNDSEDNDSEDNDSEDNDSEYVNDSEYDQFQSLSLPYTATAQLLYLFPHPSRHHWFPSWTQLQQYPDVSVRDSDPRDSDPSQTPSGMDYSLRIMSGRIYRGCSLRLIKSPTPETKAIYCSTVDDKDARLVATLPGIELDIDSRSKYVLVDISPDLSLWPGNIEMSCNNTNEGHEHLPIRPKSVIIVCLECASTDMKYRLRRVTTLEWECRQPGKPGPGCWLPFEPSLEHMRSIVCSAKGRRFLESLYKEGTDSSDIEAIDSRDNDGIDSSDNDGIDSSGNKGTDKGIDLDVFCDPVAVASLLSQEGWHEDWPQGWHSRWPGYEVYLV